MDRRDLAFLAHNIFALRPFPSQGSLTIFMDDRGAIPICGTSLLDQARHPAPVYLKDSEERTHTGREKCRLI